MRNSMVSTALFLFSRTRRRDHLEFGTLYPASVIDSHAARYSFAARLCRGKACLDVACGCGYGAQLLLYSGAARVVGGDVQHDLLKHARQHGAHAGLSLVCLDANSLPFEDLSFDVVTSFETIEHLEQPDEFVRRIVHLLKPGGVFVCSTPNRNASSPETMNPFHLREYTPNEFKALMSRHFDRVRMFGQGGRGTPYRNVWMRRIAHSLRRVGARYQFFDRLVSIVSGIVQGNLQFMRLEEAMRGIPDGVLQDELYELETGGSHEPLALVAIAHKPADSG
jgi:SAM-dependent methyltransferase